MIIYICLMAVMAYLAFRWGKETKAGTWSYDERVYREKRNGRAGWKFAAICGKMCLYQWWTSGSLLFWRENRGFPRVLAAVSILFYSLGFIRAMLILQKIQKEERERN